MIFPKIFFILYSLSSLVFGTEDMDVKSILSSIDNSNICSLVINECPWMENVLNNITKNINNIKEEIKVLKIKYTSPERLKKDRNSKQDEKNQKFLTKRTSKATEINEQVIDTLSV